jgi:hypothetical protein
MIYNRFEPVFVELPGREWQDRSVCHGPPLADIRRGPRRGSWASDPAKINARGFFWRGKIPLYICTVYMYNVHIYRHNYITDRLGNRG